ncbi:hypothetical protein F511_38240 [Dorcoceras hygrometricum]|uniref:Uncharacterized protein n=1 Tax=Dorcoceras hygrometricum TaxID=472368 RepID=A0A2Z7BQH3_9LAMI|nr:hypothetical protein F511_38240 [Dorcoceras hygrometricum]
MNLANPAKRSTKPWRWEWDQIFTCVSVPSISHITTTICLPTFYFTSIFVFVFAFFFQLRKDLYISS